MEGTASKQDWKHYLRALPDDARKQAKLHFQTSLKASYEELHQAAKASKRAKIDGFAADLEEMMQFEDFATLYNTVVKTFVTALRQDVESLEKDQRLPSFALAGKWAPSIADGTDRKTSLGKSIARALFASVHHLSEEDKMAKNFDTRAFVYYRKNVLTPLRAAINLPEALMSQNK